MYYVIARNSYSMFYVLAEGPFEQLEFANGAIQKMNSSHEWSGYQLSVIRIFKM